VQTKDRIKELRRVKASDLLANPRNWRKHPEAQQSAVRALLGEIGWADALIARELPDGSLELLDGHLRAGLDPDQQVPVLVVDLDDEEAGKYLLAADPISQMAEADQTALRTLLEQVAASSSPELDELLDRIRTEHVVLELPAMPAPNAPLAVAATAAAPVDPSLQPSHVRMVQLFLDTVTHPEFIKWEAELRARYGTENITDTVRHCVKECYDLQTGASHEES